MTQDNGAPKWSARELENLLAERYKAPEWAIAFDVASATGAQACRRADAVAMGLWPSKGLDLHAFEIKVSRSDWRREIQDPTKARAFDRFADFFWIVAPPKVVPLEELPATWGLLEASKARDKIRVRRPATKTEAEPIPRRLLAGLLRAFNEQGAVKRAADAAIAAAFERGRATAAVTGSSDARAYKRAHERLLATIRDFEEASGVKLDPYRGERIGEAVRLVLAVGVANVPDYLRGVRTRLDVMRDKVEETLATFEKGGA